MTPSQIPQAVEALEPPPTLVSSVEWAAYSRLGDPNGATPENLNLLDRRARVADQVAELLTLLVAHFRRTGKWKVAQHAAQLFFRSGHLSYATYFAHVAVELSDGDPFARISLAEVMWLRRLPSAVLTQVSIARILARRLRDPNRRRILQLALADLAVRAHAYNRTGSYLRWLRQLQRKHGTLEAWLNTMHAAISVDDYQTLLFAAPQVAAHLDSLSGRTNGKLQFALRRVLLDTIRLRP